MRSTSGWRRRCPVSSAGRLHIHTFAERPDRAVGADRPLLRAGAIAVPQLHRGSIGGIGSGHVDAFAADTGDLTGSRGGDRSGKGDQNEGEQPGKKEWS
jgi:hypothetical protein